MKLLRMHQILTMIPVSRSTIYHWVKIGQFPKPIKLSSRTSAWVEADVVAFIERRNESA